MTIITGSVAVSTSAASSVTLKASLASEGDDQYTVTKFGYNPDIDAGIEEDVWDAGGFMSYLSSAETLNILSSSTSDAVGGVGIKTITVFGLDNNYELVSESVTLTGQTTVTTVNSYLRVYRLRATGSDGVDINTQVAAGTITASASSSGNLLAQIAAGQTSTRMSHYTVPSGYTALLTHIYTSGGPADDYIVEVQSRPLGSVFATSTDLEISNSNLFYAGYDPFLGPVSEKTDIKFKATGVSNNTQVRIGYGLLLVKGGTV